MNRQGIDECYFQVAKPSAGTVTPPAKVSKGDTKDDALGNPSRYKNQTKFDAVERPDSEQAKLIGTQLGSNLGQSNGYDPEASDYITPAPRRGFNQK
jgi:hypothetical protein